MHSELAGITNGHLVIPGLWRGGEICTEGYKTLSQLGIQDVYCFKNSKDDDAEDIEREEKQVESFGMNFWHFPLDNQGFFSYHDGSKVQSIIDAMHEDVAAKRNVYCHCHHGSDRTGVVIACYGMDYLNWTLKEALESMHRYGNAWYNRGMRAFVKEYAVTVL